MHNSYWNKGDTFHPVGATLFKIARDGDGMAGAGEFLHCLGDEYLKRSECSNDHEFGFMRGMCG